MISACSQVPQGSEELLRDKLGADASLRALKQLLIERTEGNPIRCKRVMDQRRCGVGAFCNYLCVFLRV